MQLTLSSKGQIVLPAPVRRRLRLKARAKLELEEREGGVFLRPAQNHPAVAPIKSLRPGALKFGPADYALDKFAAAAGEDDTP
jgi:AbrB family looped-hinge helix DNA binding protein